MKCPICDVNTLRFVEAVNERGGVDIVAIECLVPFVMLKGCNIHPSSEIFKILVRIRETDKEHDHHLELLQKQQLVDLAEMDLRHNIGMKKLGEKLAVLVEHIKNKKTEVDHAAKR